MKYIFSSSLSKLKSSMPVLPRVLVVNQTPGPAAGIAKVLEVTKNFNIYLKQSVQSFLLSAEDLRFQFEDAEAPTLDMPVQEKKTVAVNRCTP